MALAGVASAGEPVLTTSSFNEALSKTVERYYTSGSSYTLTIDIEGYNYTSGIILKMPSNNYYMMSQSSGNYGYVGLSYKEASNDIYINSTTTANPGLVKDASILTASPSTNTSTWTMGSGDYLYSWISTDPKANLSEMKTEQKYIDKAIITLDYDGSSTTLTFAVENNITSVVKLTDTFIDITDVQLGSLVQSASGTFTTDNETYVIPEPATATLSLLALTGLAARRRRH